MIKRIFLLMVWMLLTVNAPLYADGAFSRLLTQEDSQDFLPVDEAFQVRASVVDAHQAEVLFTIAPGHYLYRSRIAVTVPEGESGQLVEVILPAGEEKQDPNFGPQRVFHHDTVAQIRFAEVHPTTLTVRYQGCSEKGLCYPPQTKQLTLNAAVSSAAASATLPVTASPANVADDDVSSALLRGGQWWKIILGFLGAGLLLSFTPCVFPMIPILSGIIIGKQAHTSRAKAFSLSLAYTLGMSLTYTLAGIAAGFSGQLLSTALQTPLALSIGALIFVGLSFSMFGYYELKLPSQIENAFFQWSTRFKGGHLFSDFLMGAISALIISPCVAAPLAGALLYISQTHDWVLGGVALFSLSLGMGVPLLLIGASAGTLLPKAGPWMNAVRQVFGVLMLAVAVWVISPLLSTSVQWVLWASLCIVPAVHWRAMDALPENAQPIQRVMKGLAVMLLIYGIALLVGAWSGAQSVLYPLQSVATTATSVAAPTRFQRVHSVQELNTLIANAAGQPVMLDFYADWCVACKEYEQFVFSQPAVQQALSGMVLLQADVTANSQEDAALLKQFGLFGPPGIVFFNGQGQTLSPIIKGYQDAQQFVATLQRLHL